MTQTFLRSILVATDLSEGSDDALRAAGTLAARFGAGIHAVHVPTPAGADLVAAPMVAGVYEARNEGAERALDDQIRRTLPTGPEPATRHLRVGGVHEVIQARADAVSADLIVLGGHRGLALDRVTGGTLERVAAQARVPCLVVNAPFSLPVRRMGVAVDLGDPVMGAVELAFRWANVLGSAPGPEGAELFAIHAGYVVDMGDDPAIIQQNEAELQRLVADARERVGEGEKAVRGGAKALCGSTPAQAMGLFSEHLGMLVVSTRGNRGLKRLVLGSVTGGLLRNSRCPLLVVPPALRPAPEDDRGGASAVGRAGGVRASSALRAEAGGASPSFRAGRSNPALASGKSMPRSIRNDLVSLALAAALMVVAFRLGLPMHVPLAFGGLALLLVLGWHLFGRLRR